eukprot:CAMPEP_0119382932 /NCGR_PEP_ID=MMETSP1334-20130426/75892_1 /TAXON_ID=127549 /ORGANISM="Calcidiscus leptoporus, Strain RCC1130" /LENGTH=65 /DNA_ID=CAMNT_0007403577 /DNA_START=165 /DNA_END=362 /DNA_ORIENTATION=-
MGYLRARSTASGTEDPLRFLGSLWVERPSGTRGPSWEPFTANRCKCAWSALHLGADQDVTRTTAP